MPSTLAWPRGWAQPHFGGGGMVDPAFQVRSYLIQEDARFVVVSYKLESKNRFKYVLALIM